MKVHAVRAIGREWVSETASSLTGFKGAFFCGSINSAQNDAEFPITSDLDLTLVFEGIPPEVLPGNFLHSGVIFGVSYWPFSRLLPLERVLSDYRLGYNFRKANVISSSSSKLNEMAAVVSQAFPQRRWVSKRIEDARTNCLNYVNSVSERANEFDRVIAWLWATGITTHIVLAAALKNPTIRKRYLAAHDVLSEYGHLDFYEFLHTLQGSSHFNRVITQTYFDSVTEVFDVACDIEPRPFPYSSDLSRISRPISIDGTQELINQGNHRESVFWIAATYARCMKAFHHTKTSTHLDRFSPGFESLIVELGITSPDDLRLRTDEVRASIPRVMAIAQSIMESHPDIEDL